MMTALLSVPHGMQKAREFTHVIATAHLDMAEKSDKAVVDILGENVFDRKKQSIVVFLPNYSVQFVISNQGHCIPKCTAMSRYSLKSFDMILKWRKIKEKLKMTIGKMTEQTKVTSVG